MGITRMGIMRWTNTHRLILEMEPEVTVEPTMVVGLFASVQRAPIGEKIVSIRLSLPPTACARHCTKCRCRPANLGAKAPRSPPCAMCCGDTRMR